jgi:hypothetical protein
MPPRSQSQAESKRGLIITLVFFILATLGLGVSTYMGFADQDKLEKAAKEAQSKEKTFKDDREYYKKQAALFRGYMGMTEGMEDAGDLGSYQKELKSGSLGKNLKDNANVTKLVNDLDAKYGWNGNQPKESLEGSIKKLQEEYENTQKRLATTVKEREKARDDKANLEKELQTAQADYKKKIDQLAKTYTDDSQKSRDDLAKFRSDYEKESAARAEDNKRGEEDKKTLAAQMKKKDEDIRTLKDRVKDRESRLASLESRSQQAAQNLRTDWKIVAMDPRGTSPYINLGSADRVHTQLTFNVHGIAANGQVDPKPKATLEVINVVGPHLSQTRITSVVNRNRDPVLKGDVIANSSWDPNLKKHVAIVGIIDLAGDGRDNLFEFIRNLERQNIVVDAYLNPRDNSIKGQITFRTDYLIVGEPRVSAIGSKVGDAEKQFQVAQKQMQDDAKKYGAQVVSLAHYLGLIGYHVPHSARDRGPTTYNPDLRPDQLPRLGGDRAPPTAPGKEQAAPTPTPTAPDK